MTTPDHTLMERYLEGGIGERLSLVQRADDPRGRGWARRLCGPRPRPYRAMGAMKTPLPPIREPWPETAEQWYACATVMQLRSDHRRETERAIRRNHRREMQAMLKAGGVVIGCLLAMAAFWLVAWGLWAVAG